MQAQPADLSDDELGRLLSLDTKTPSPSLGSSPPTPRPPTSPVRLIGYGACGAIFARNDAAHVFKLAKTRDDQLWNDYVQHTRVWEAMHAFGLYHETAVPRPAAFVAAEDVEGGEGEGRARRWWSRHGDLAAAVAAGNHVNVPTAVLSSEKIIPLPLPLRNALIQRFCHADNQAAAAASPGNADCLVRIYLGSYSRKSRGGSGGGSDARTNRFFSLRNFKLHLDQLRELRVDTQRLARCMAGALAATHWGARVDARDVEFVVGAPPSSGPSPSRSSWIPLPSALLRTMAPNTSTVDPVCPRRPDTPLRLWLLDFNQCGDVGFDAAGVRRAVDAFWTNDPYCPRPPRGDGGDGFEGALWDTFVARYLEISATVLAGEEPRVRNLPRMFVDALVERARR